MPEGSPEAPSLVARVLSPRRRAWLARPRSHLLIALVGVALCAPALGLGLRLDDHVHQLLVRGGDEARLMWTDPPHPLDPFRFVDGDRADWRRGLETGAAPWYTSPDVRLAFFRPLAAVTHVFDYTVLAGAPWAMHLHSLAWLLVLGLAVGRLVRRVEGGWIAGLILLFYLLDAGHGVPAGWLSNRNPLIAGALGALALEAHLAWREGERRGPWLSIALFAGALLAGETAIGWVAFFAAYALTLDPRGTRAGLLALLPIGAVLVVWRVVYRALGYGAKASAIYVDPVAEPGRFGLAVLERLPQLLGGQLGGPPAGVAALASRRAQLTAAGLALAVVAVLVAFLLPRLRRDAKARFWGLGALLATIPVCATHPHPRLMIVAGLGVLAVVARYVASVVSAVRPGRAPRLLAAFWLLSLGVLSPLRLPFESWSTALIGNPAQLAIDGVPPEAVGRTMVVVAVPDPMFMCGQLPLALASLDRPRPARQRCLAGSEGVVDVTREDPHTLAIRAPDGLLAPFFVPLLRHPDDPFAADWRLRLSDATFTLAERDPDGQPVALRVRFDAPLDDPSHVFVVWSPEERRYVVFEPPPVGETVRVEQQPLAELVLPSTST